MLTDEQAKIIAHDYNNLDLVVEAGPGTGKTFTAVRCVLRMLNDGLDPKRILVVMFNKEAQLQFKRRLIALGVPKSKLPIIRTLHSLALGIVRKRVAGRIDIASEAQMFYWVNKALTSLDETLDPQQCLSDIGLWKARGIMPQNAVHSYAPMVSVYREFNGLLDKENVVTFSDLAMIATGILDEETDRYYPDVIVVDEAQDLNKAFIDLVEALRGPETSLILFGDTDQTLYTWNGAEHGYMRKHSEAATSMSLTKSFRFGKELATVAANLISNNEGRPSGKLLVASDTGKESRVEVIRDEKFPGSHNIAMAEEITRLVIDQGVDPKAIAVLVRTYTQADRLQVEMLGRIPFQVDGREYFYQRRENAALVAYLRLAEHLNEPVKLHVDDVVTVMRVPFRMISPAKVEAAAKTYSGTVSEFLAWLSMADNSPAGSTAKRSILFLLDLLENLGLEAPAHQALLEVYQDQGVEGDLERYYGLGSQAQERIRAISNFIRYVERVGCSASELDEHLKSLDPLMGVHESKAILVTTVYRQKGKEYEYVFLPEMNDGLMPINAEENELDRVSGIGYAPILGMSHTDQERCVTFTALTRAKNVVYIGVGSNPSQFLYEMDIDGTKRALSSMHDPGALSGMMMTETTAELLRIYNPDLNGFDPLLRQKVSRNRRSVWTDWRT
jgi:DNA helicase-2/ATP-dependent DNA helicase PcrA